MATRLYLWLLLCALVLAAGLRLGLGALSLFSKEGIGSAEFERFAVDAANEYWPPLLLPVLGYWIPRWMRSFVLAEVGRHGLRLRCRLSRRRNRLRIPGEPRQGPPQEPAGLVAVHGIE
ncbi:MAG TPA: hypothetical protein VNK67_00130 [Burkholderiales bacterium]|nr:hypothetical protein [Burkholderiales bacterium]